MQEQHGKRQITKQIEVGWRNIGDKQAVQGKCIK